MALLKVEISFEVETKEDFEDARTMIEQNISATMSNDGESLTAGLEVDVQDWTYDVTEVIHGQ